MVVTARRALTGSAVAGYVGAILTHICKAKSGQCSTVFDGVCKPKIRILDYVVSMQRTFPDVAEDVFLHALIYIERIVTKLGVGLNDYNVHRLFIVSLRVAIKFVHEDFCYRSKDFAKAAGIPVVELNRMEMQYLFLMKFQLYVSQKDLDQQRSMAEQVIQMTVSRKKIVEQKPKMTEELPMIAAACA